VNFIRVVWGTIVVVGAIAVLSVAEIALFWLGRGDTPRGEMVVDLDDLEDVDHDDPGQDVDEEST